MKKEASKTTKKISRELSVKALLELHNKDMKRYVGSLSEEFRGQVSAVAEQFVGLNKKLDSHTEMIGGMKEDIEVIKMNIEMIKADVRKRVTYDEFQSLTKRVSLLEKKSHRR